MEVVKDETYYKKYKENYGGDVCPSCFKQMTVDGSFYVCKDCGTRLSKICQDMKAEWFR
nr:MAG TPA: TFIIB zinc-binding [Caudoviricetes sp.]